MSTKIIAMLLAGYALWRCGGVWRQYHLAQQQAQSKAKPGDEVRWEGEGGALRSSGPQLQPVGQQTPG